MKKLFNILFVTAIVSCSTSNGQNDYLSLNWKKGDHKQIILTTHAKIGEDSQSSQEFTITQHAELWVENETDSTYNILLKEENMLYCMAKNYCTKNQLNSIEDKMMTKNIIVDKNTKTGVVTNTDEVKEILNQTYNKFQTLCQDDKADTDEKFRKQMEEIYTNGTKKPEENDLIDLILTQYKNMFKEGQKLYSIDSTANPLNLQGFPGGKVITYITNSSQKKSVDLHINVEYDFEAYKKMMESLSNGMTNTLKGMIPDNTANTDELGNLLSSMYANLFKTITFDAEENTVITQSKKNNWPSEILRSGEVKITQAGKTQLINISTLVTIN